jgi:hypothetical protein
MRAPGTSSRVRSNRAVLKWSGRRCRGCDLLLLLDLARLSVFQRAPQCAAAAASFTKDHFLRFAGADGAETVWLVPQSLWGDGAAGEWRLRHVQVCVNSILLL